MIYLACPYSHDDIRVMNLRFEIATNECAKLMKTGHVVYSPITHGHVIQDLLPDNLRTDHAFWLKQCMPVLSACSEVMVLNMDGTHESKGVQWEVDTARVLGKRVTYIDVPAWEHSTQMVTLQEGL